MRLVRKTLAQILFCLVSLFLAGCGRTAVTETAEDGYSESSEGQSAQKEMNLLSTEWKLSGDITEAESMWSVADYVEGFLPRTEGRTPGICLRASDGASYFVLSEFYALHNGEQSREWFLTEYNTDRMDGETLPLMLKATEGTEELASALEAMENLRANIVGMDIVSGAFRYFLQVHDEEGATVQLLAISAERDGNVSSAVDLLPALTAAGFGVQKGEMISGCYCDAEGRAYVSAFDGAAVYILDREGTLLHTMATERQELLVYRGKLPAGIPVFEYWRTQDDQNVLIAFDGVKTAVLYSGEGFLGEEKDFSRSGEVYFLNGKELFCWNAPVGSCQMIYDKMPTSGCDAILQNAAGDIFAFFQESSEHYAIRLVNELEAESVELEILMTTFGEYVSDCAAAYTRRHPGVTIQVKSPDGVFGDVLLNQLLTDISQGNGPGLLVLRREQLLALQDKGALEDLSGVLRDETVSQIYPGVMQNGMVGNALYGITCETSVSTLLVSDNTWKEKTWTLDEVLALMEESVALERFACLSYDTTAVQMLYELALADMENTPFLDVTSKKCSYGTAEFEALLELCKRYGKETAGDSNLSLEEQRQEMAEGRALAYAFDGGFLEFGRALAAMGEDYRCVGYPTQGDSGSYFNFYNGCVAVSTGAEHREIIDDFLNYLLDYETQRRYCTDWVRRDVLQDCVKEQVELYGEKASIPIFVMGEREVIPLTGREDGTSYLPEYLELMEQCIPRKTEWNTVRSIIMEEAAAFFAGDKSAHEVAGIIQNRVQLYLEEL